MGIKRKDTKAADELGMDHLLYGAILESDIFRQEMARLSLQEKELALVRVATVKNDKAAHAKPGNFQVTHSLRFFSNTLENLKDYVYTLRERGHHMNQAMALELGISKLIKGVDLKMRPERIRQLERERAANQLIGKMLKDPGILKAVKEFTLRDGQEYINVASGKASKDKTGKKGKS